MFNHLLSIVALLAPRAFILMLWQTNWEFRNTFTSQLWLTLGFCLAPYATLAYAAAIYNNGSISGYWQGLVVAAAIIDGIHWAGNIRQQSLRLQKKLAKT